MRKIWKWIKNNPNRTMFLIPILLVAGISISHVVSWYDIGNPYNWAIYLSIAIEVGAMTALVAATNKIKGGVWWMFGLVTFIQFIGNIFYSYKEIDPNGEGFKMWVELTGPIWDMFTDSTDIPTMKRWLAILQGGLLPLISLTSLHFFVKYEKPEEKEIVEPENLKVLRQPISGVVVELEDEDEKKPGSPQPTGKVFYVDLEDTNEEETDHSLIEEDNPEDDIIIPVVEEKPKVDPKTGNIDLKYDPKLVDEDFYLTQREKPKVDPKKVIKTEPKMVKEDFSKTKGEELNQTWRNIVKRRRNKGNNGIERI